MAVSTSFDWLRQRYPWLGLAHLSVLLVGLMWVLPFLYFVHRNPLTTFYQEWGAAMLGLASMLVLLVCRGWRGGGLPRIFLLPFGLMLLVWLQFFLGKIGYFSQALLVSLYLFWAALLTILGQQLRERVGLPALATALAVFLLAGAELSALIGILQQFPWRTFMDAVVQVKNGVSMFGNMGQSNHFADYTVMGLVSLGLLYASGRLRIWQTVALGTPLVYVLVMSGSRSSWLFLLAIAVVAFFWQRRDKSALPLLYYCLAVVLGFVVMHWLVATIPALGGSYGSITAGQRMLGAGITGGGNVRLHLWREAWLIFLQFPFFGAGWGRFGWEHFQMLPVLRDAVIAGLYYNHTHNLVMQVAADMGLAGLVVLLGSLALWLRQAWYAQRTVYHWWGYGLLLVLGIHSLLEYPLWYGYFLGVAAFTMGMLDNTACDPGACAEKVRGGRKVMVVRASAAVILMLGVLFMSLSFQAYRRLENLNSQVVPESARGESYAERVLLRNLRTDLQALDKDFRALLFHHYVEYVLGEAGWEHVADQGELNERVLHFAPVDSVAYRQAMLLSRLGRHEEARVQMERAIWAYPSSFPEIVPKLRRLAEVDPDPAGFPALMQFALLKYEERRRMNKPS